MGAHVIVFALLSFIALRFGPAQNSENGLDDYRKAEQMLRSQVFGELVEWGSRDYENLLDAKRAAKDNGEAWSKDAEAALQRAKQNRDLGYLGREKRLLDSFGAVLEVVGTGSTKPAWNPDLASMDADAEFIQAGAFKHIAKLYAACAYVRFSEGDSKAGTALLIDGYTFALHIGGWNMHSEMVSIACRSIILTEFERELPLLSDEDAVRVAGFVDSALSGPNTYLQAVTNEGLCLGALREGMLRTLLPDLTPAQLRQVEAKLKPKAQQVVAPMLSRIKGDESTWLDPVAEADLPPKPKEPNSLQDVIESLPQMLLSSDSQQTVVELQSRVQLRLLCLHARIIDFKWKHNRLPLELSEAAPEALTHDPMTNGPFQYTVTDSGYRLFAKGTKETGPIELGFHRKPKGSSSTGQIPPDPATTG